jgi:hypothetical protein
MDGFNVIASSNLRLNGPFLDTGWQFRGFGDFDVDGKTDVFWQHTDGSTNVWLMDGDSVWQQGGYGVDVVGAGWQIKGFGDFDGDGTTDVLWMHGNGMVRFWQMYGVYGWSPDPLGPYAGWEIQGVGDFNGDAMSDVFWRATGTSGTTMVWLMGEMGWGGGYFEWGEWGYVYSPDNPYLELMISGAQAIGFRDFNGDEKTDVLWNRAEFEANFTWQIDGFSASCCGNYGFAGAQLTGFGDFDGDGATDVVYQQPAGPFEGVWIGLTTNGQGHPTFGLLGGVPASYVLVDPVR